MTTNIATANHHPTDAKTGLTLPLSKFLGSQALAKHQAMVALELEVMAKKMDRFGWDRDRGTLAHDRLMKDWISALQDFPLSEVQAACREWVAGNPRKMPNEGDIRGVVMNARQRQVASMPKVQSDAKPRPRVTGKRASEILAEVGLHDRFKSVRAAE